MSIYNDSFSKSSKRKRSKSPKNDRKYESAPSCSYTRSFTFTAYKYELNKVIGRFGKDCIITDLSDFWLFVNKFEDVIKKRSNKAPAKPQINTEDIPEKITKEYNSKVEMIQDVDNLYSRLPIYDPDYDRRPKLTRENFEEFLKVVQLYLDFKLRESCTKIRKLFETQKNLPVYQYKNEIIETVQSERVVLIAGDTGCGKSTQVPQYLYHLGYSRIACTQPRRIACISLAKRVAFETLTESEVGYQIRFEKQKNKDTKILFITEGLLLRQLSTEVADIDYDVIILDEVHERHLHGDFLMGIVKCLIYQRPEIKIVLMSATINIELFSNYFASENAKVIQVPGRLFPIKLHYRPIFEDKYAKSERFNPRPYIQVLQLIDEKYTKNEKGDVLIFLSGMNEITTVLDAAKEYAKINESWIILPLHSSLSLAEQDKVFDYPPEGVRKCIISTNIAETSITIDGIRFVIDSGKVKEMSYDPVSRMQKLKEFWISRASAEQRKGRAGRTGSGVCFRLYSEKEYDDLELYSTPEIQRVPLDSLLLQMISMGLPDARQFPFIEPPSSEAIENAISSLKHIDALTENEQLTIIGKALSRLPVDIILGKMLILSTVFHQVESVLSLAAALSVQTPFTNKAYRDLECQSKLKEIESDHGDPITLLNAYKEWLEVKYNGDGDSRKWCRKRGLEEQRFYEITKLQTQFKELLEDCLLIEGKDEAQTSSDRAIRHGELRHLRKLRYDYKKAGPRKRQVLKVDFYETGNEADVDEEIDIRDVEFRLKHDSGKVQKLLSGATACNFTDIMILKLIICSGLYPQIAVADEFNYCKSTSEQLFHAKTKAFVALHPMSYFGNHPEILQLQENEIEVPPDGYYSKRPLSSKHQMLCYLSLLETTKPYLMNTIRMPIAQTLMLFAHCIETNASLTRMVFDSWTLLEFPFPENGQILLTKAAKIRQKWNTLLSKKIMTTDKNDAGARERDSRTFENYLEKDLISYMRSEISYTVHRLLPADLKTIYSGEPCERLDVNPFDSSFESLPYRKGGIQLTENIFFNCLVETEWSVTISNQMEQTPWTCNGCGIEFCFSSIDKLQHQALCKVADKSSMVEDSVNQQEHKPNSTSYFCEKCDSKYNFTSVEILKHKNKHANKK